MKSTGSLWLLLGSLAVVLSGAVSCGPPENATSQPLLQTGWQIGNLAPDFSLVDLDGKLVSLIDFRGKPVMINFWTTWCPSCVKEMPYLQQMYGRQSGEELVFLAINIQESPAKVREFFARHALSLPVLLDLTGSTSNKYGVNSIPSTFFIDGNGVIKQKVVGAFPNERAIETELRKTLP